ncbi:hypothetical protein ACQCQ1_23570, partial [Ralstonia pseudosolanacearum]
MGGQITTVKLLLDEGA